MSFKPKRKKQIRSTGSTKVERVEQCFEPSRKSLYDVVCENFRNAARITYVHRIIYIGEHTFSQNPESDNYIGSAFRNNINYVNSFYCDEVLTGFLLHYTKFFCHVVEGSEEVITKHLQLLLNNTETASYLGVLKLLIASHHINQRFLNVWTEIGTKPPNLLENMIPNSDLNITNTRLFRCLQKIYRLGIKLRTSNAEFDMDRNIRMSSVEDTTISTRSLLRVVSTVSTFEGIGKPIDCLPESQLLDYLIQNIYIQNLKDYADAYGSVAKVKIYADLAWPVMADFMPQDVFDEEFDPVMDLEEGNLERKMTCLSAIVLL